jgi:CubicO group peptidase (beta-lactamase class C family)
MPARLLSIGCLLCLASCLSLDRPGLPLEGEYRYAVPTAMEDGLQTGQVDPALFGSRGMAALDDFFGRLRSGTYGEIHGVVLVHRGRLVVEEYFPGYRFYGPLTTFSAADRHHLASVTKSLTSLCVGIAIDRGFITSVDQAFLDYYRDYPVPERELKQGITIRHLLTMTAGLAWDEWSHPYTDLRNDVVRFYRSLDPLRFILTRKPVALPGARWAYSGAYPNLLGDIIYRASGLTLDTFAAEYLYRPLGITDSSWVTLHKGFIYASGDAELRPRDMAKIGMLVLNRGTWQGRRVVSERWIELSMQRAARADPADDYGFMWWLPVLQGSAAERLGPVYMGSGWGGQYIVVLPERDLVVVLTGGNYGTMAPETVPIIAAMLRLLTEP